MIMKKLLLAFAIGTASLVTFSSCTKETINYLPGKTIVLPVKPTDWERDGNMYSYSFDMPEVTDRIFEDGFVDVAISFDKSPNYYDNIAATIGNYHYSFQYGKGVVTVYAEFLGSNPVPPEGMLVKIMVSDAEIGN